MATIKSYTDLEQSKKLAEILPLESADMCYLPTHIGDEHHFIVSLSPYSVCTKMIDVSIEYCTPCWSLAALLDIIPKHIKGYNVLRIDIGDNDTSIWYYDVGCGVNNELPDVTKEFAIDACYEMILKLNELKLL